jgi:apolipoprotein N-acyltransferase
VPLQVQPSVLQAVFLILAGLAHAASIAAPWSGEPVWWLQLLAMGVLVWQIQTTDSPRQAAWRGWLFTTAWLCGTFWWLFISMHTYGGLNAALTVLAIVGLAAALALCYAAACYAFRSLSLENSALSATVFAALWVMAEMARGTWLTGFGWGAAGYAHLDSLGGFAKYVGAYGLAGLAAFVACSLTMWVIERRKSALGIVGLQANPYASLKALAPVALIAVLAVVGDRQFSAPAGSLEVALLQGNIKQSEKFEPSTGIADALKWYSEQMRASKAALVVAPETAIPLLPQQLPEGYLNAVTAPFSSATGSATNAPSKPVGQALLVGIPLGSYSAGYTNSVIGIKPGLTANAPYTYSKHHLVPFGEFIPPLFKWFTQMMNIPLGDFNRGAVGQPSFEWQGQRLAPNICYEDLFGEELGARFIDPAKAPTIFVNLSNIGWFGNTLAIDQHRNISRMRALEFERPFIRATNTGDTVIINHKGEVTHALPRHTRGVLTGLVEGRAGDALSGDGITPFAYWVARYGLWPIWLISVAIVIIAASARNSRLRGRFKLE